MATDTTLDPLAPRVALTPVATPSAGFSGKLLEKQAGVPRIVVVGGGAGGLELVTRLGDKLGMSGRAEIVLVDKALVHLWKPLLHEAAAGTLSPEEFSVTFLGHASQHHFRFRLGTLDSIDRAAKVIHLAPTLDEDGNEISPHRIIPYDTLVIAVGSVTNDFGIPGVKEHAWPLNEPLDAVKFHRKLLAAAVHCQILDGQEPLDVAIVGAGATGVELAAELHYMVRQFVAYGLDNLDPERIKIRLISSTPRILPGLSDTLAADVHAYLEKLGIEIFCNELVTEVTTTEVFTKSGNRFPAMATVWAGGIKAPDFLKQLGLETNRLNQLVVNEYLQTSDPDIYAFGDCAAAHWAGQPEGVLVPPRAQAAHQQASLLARNLMGATKGKALLPYQYRDFGSLVSLGRSNVLGDMLGKPNASGFKVQGAIARFMYWGLHQMHLLALHGYVRLGLRILSRLVAKPALPRIKLH